MKANSGFTLIEVMVALVIFALVSVLAAEGLKTLLRSHDIIQAQSNILEDLQFSTLLMDHNLSQTINRSIRNEQNILEPALRGEQSYLEFTHGGVVNPDGLAVKSTLQRIAYFVDTQGQLIQRQWPVLDRTAKTLFNDRVLMKEITGVRYRYIDNKNQYTDIWPAPNKTGLPRAVQMTLTLKQAGELLYVFIIPGNT